MQTLHVDLGRQWRGGQRQCLLLCTRLAGAGVGVSLVCRPRRPLWQQAHAEDLPPESLDPVADLDPLAVSRLLGLLRKTRPLIAAAHEAHALTLLAVALRFWPRRAGRAPALVYHRRVDVPLGKNPLARWKFSRVDRFICVSERIADILHAGGIPDERISVVHSGTRGVAGAQGALGGGGGAGLNAGGVERLAGSRAGGLERPLGPRVGGGVRVRGARAGGVEEPLSIRAAVREELGIGPDVVVLGTVGGLIPHKGHGVLIDALGMLRAADRSGDIQLLVVGDGPLREHLERRAVSRGLGLTVRFLGERSDVEVLLAAMDIFIHPSLTEGLGSSIADAFSAGVPVIASRAGGIPEIVRHGETGWLVPPGDAGALADTIGHAVDHREMMLAMAARARELYKAELTDEAMARKTMAVYRAIVGGATAVTDGAAGGRR
jgi:glycosyltransferase involved in cell wall biosynthesis